MRHVHGIGPLARLITARSLRLRWWATALDLRAKRGETVPFEHRLGIRRLCDGTERVGIGANARFNLSLYRGLGEYPTCIFRDVLKGADHSFGLLRQMKKKLDRLGIDLRDDCK